MIVLLRFVGILNASVWLGAAIFFTFGVAPGIFSPELKKLFGPAYTGLFGQSVVARFFLLQYCCGGIALLHQLAEWVYLGRAFHKITLGVLMGLCAISLVGGLVLQPKMKKWHQIKYSTELYRRELFLPEEKAHAAKLFGAWHGVSATLNLLALGGLAFYLWRMANPGDGTRFVPAGKFRR